MSLKVRQLKAELRRAGFSSRSGKGSHTVWTHPALPRDELTIAGQDGNDAQRYQIKQVRKILEKLRGAN